MKREKWEYKKVIDAEKEWIIGLGSTNEVIILEEVRRKIGNERMLEMVIMKGLKIFLWQGIVYDHGDQLLKLEGEQRTEIQELKDHLCGTEITRNYDGSSARELKLLIWKSIKENVKVNRGSVDDCTKKRQQVGWSNNLRFKDGILERRGTIISWKLKEGARRTPIPPTESLGAKVW